MVYDRTSEIRYVVVDLLSEDERLSFFDLERFENDFSPVAVFQNEDPMRENDAKVIGSERGDMRSIKIYKIDEDISGYFSPPES